MVPSVDAESSSTQPMFRETNSWVSKISRPVPAKARQYKRKMPFTRSSSRLDDRVSSIASEVLDSILKKAIPLSGFSWSRCAPCWNQVSNWLTVMRLRTSSRLFRKDGTASGVITTRASQRSNM